MSQMMRTTTVYPKSVVDFSLFESMIDSCMNASSSVKSQFMSKNGYFIRMNSGVPGTLMGT
ncbi:hypothetical protein V8B55DRAFT_1515436 [Mucor lusitanicus]